MQNKNTSNVGLWLCLGAAFGLIYDNLPIGAAIGVVIGVVLDSTINKQK